MALHSTKGQMRRDLHSSKVYFHSLREKLVDLDQQELELLSLNWEPLKGSKSIRDASFGVFSSIYHEKLMHFIHKSYGNQGEQERIIFRTKRNLFNLEIDPEKSSFYLDGELIGHLNSEGQLLKEGREIARIGLDDNTSNCPIYLDGKMVARLSKLSSDLGVNPRAFESLENLNSGRRNILIGLSILYILQNSLD